MSIVGSFKTDFFWLIRPRDGPVGSACGVAGGDSGGASTIFFAFIPAGMTSENTTPLFFHLPSLDRLGYSDDSRRH
jgi:hypothetical protein